MFQFEQVPLWPHPCPTGAEVSSHLKRLRLVDEALDGEVCTVVHCSFSQPRAVCVRSAVSPSGVLGGSLIRTLVKGRMRLLDS